MTGNNAKRALVIGCGIAGPVTAMYLRRAGFAPVIFEAAPGPDDQAGAWLTVAPNGMSVLRGLGIESDVRSAGFATPGIIFHSANGRRFGVLDGRDYEQQFGAPSLNVKRGLLQRALREASVQRGIPVEFGKKLAGIDLLSEGGVRAWFDDGTEAQGDLLVGCDGIRSRTRQLMFPESPAPEYTGMIGCGGFTRTPAVEPEQGWIHMTFGARAFFGYAVAPDGEVFWFNNLPRAQSAPPAMSQGKMLQLLLDAHRDDASPIPEIVSASQGNAGLFPIYDIPSLPLWHRESVVLVGDAAHATSPHAGQGASMAMEDAIALARCLRDAADMPHGLAAYQAARQGRVEKLVAQARRNGAGKGAGSLVGNWVRDRLFPLFLRAGAAQNREVFGYHVDWSQRAA